LDPPAERHDWERADLRRQLGDRRAVGRLHDHGAHGCGHPAAVAHPGEHDDENSWTCWPARGLAGISSKLARGAAMAAAGDAETAAIAISPTSRAQRSLKPFFTRGIPSG